MRAAVPGKRRLCEAKVGSVTAWHSSCRVAASMLRPRLSRKIKCRQCLTARESVRHAAGGNHPREGLVMPETKETVYTDEQVAAKTRELGLDSWFLEDGWLRRK